MFWRTRIYTLLLNLSLLLLPALSAIAQVQVEQPAFVELGPTNYTSPDETGVTNSGSFSIGFALEVLPARRGLVPDLSFVYDPTLTNGILGAGWRMPITSKIERVGEMRGVPFLVSNETPLYLLDGQELVPTGGSNYRVLYDDFAYVNNTLMGWAAEKDGITRIYGSGMTISSAACGSTAGATDYQKEKEPLVVSDECPEHPVAWHLRTITDAFGNRITFTYGFHPQSKLRRLESITYGHRGTVAAAENYHAIELRYENRDDVRKSYRDGYGRAMTSRLATIAVKSIRGAQERVTHYYRFDYRESTKDGQSLLEAVVQLPVEPGASAPESDAVGRMLHSFGYQNTLSSTAGWHDAKPLQVMNGAGLSMPLIQDAWKTIVEEVTAARESPSETLPDSWVDSYTVLADVDADSRPDMLVLNTMCNKPGSSDRVFRHGELENEGDIRLENLGTGPPADLDGLLTYCVSDHRVFLNRTQHPVTQTDRPIDDFSSGVRSATRSSVTTSTAAGGPYFVHNSELSEQLNKILGPTRVGNFASERLDYEFQDLNKDGYVDILRGEAVVQTPSWADNISYSSGYVLGSPEGWDENDVVSASWVDGLDGKSIFSGEHYRWADMNGDGLPDLIGERSYYLNQFNPSDGNLRFFGNALAHKGSFENPLMDTEPNFGSSNAQCMQASSPEGVLRLAQGHVNVNQGANTYYKPGLVDAERISAADWVWRNTQFADFNGDGLADMLIAVEWLEEKSEYEHDFDTHPDTVWDTPDRGRDCGSHNEIYYGDGRGGFHSAGYGIGGPTTYRESTMQSHSPPHHVTTYTYKVNHFSIIEADGSGWPQVTQYCGAGSINEAFVALYNWGESRYFLEIPNGPIGSISGSSSTVEKGYRQEQIQDACIRPPDIDDGIPVRFAGLDPIDAVYGSMTDIDGDGFADGFLAFNPNHESYDSNELHAGDGEPLWFENKRTVPQDRLVRMTNELGGDTRFAWTKSANVGDNPGVPINLDIIKHVTGSSGRFEFLFKEGVYSDQRFMGFGRVETATPKGLDIVETYNTTVALQGTRRSRQVYASTAEEAARLHTLDVYGHGSMTILLTEPQTGEREVAAIIPDLQEPYFNPMFRHCRFEFADREIVLEDIDQYQAMCDDFGDEAFVDPCLNPPDSHLDPVAARRGGCDLQGTIRDYDRLPWQTFEAVDRDTWTVLRDAHALHPFKITEATGSTADRESLEILSRFASRKAPKQPITPGETPQVRLEQHILERSKSKRDASFPRITNNTAPLSTFQSQVPQRLIAPRPAGWTSELEASERPVNDWNSPLDDVIGPGYRMYVMEYRYDNNIGVVDEVRAWRDVSRIDDSAIQTMTWHEGESNGYRSPRLASTSTVSRNGRFLARYEYEGYEGDDMWRTRIQTDEDGNVFRRQRRDVDDHGMVTTSYAWGNSRPHNYVYDQCGLASRSEDALGGWTDTVRGMDCRVRSIERNTGYRETRRHDAFGRVIEETRSAGEGLPDESYWYVYDDGPELAWQSPARVEIKPEDAGYGVIKFYVDEHGRDVKQQVCVISHCENPFQCQNGNNLDEQFPCDADDAEAGRFVTTTETAYYEDTGELAWHTQRFDARDETPPTHAFTYDPFGRLLTSTGPDGETTSHSYGLGVTHITDPEGRVTKRVFDTVTSQTQVGTVIRSKETRDAFGRTIEATGAEGYTSTMAYDEYNRLASVRYPEVEVLDTRQGCDIEPVTLRPFVLYAYTIRDEVVSETNQNGEKTTYQYDALGRLVETRGPGEVVLKTASYQHDRLPYPDRHVISTDGLGNLTVSWLDGMDRAWKTVAPDGTEELITYDQQRRAKRSEKPWGEVVNNTYNLMGEVIEIQRALGSESATERLSYNARGQVLRQEDSDGAVMTQQYGASGRLRARFLGNPDVTKPLLAERYVYDRSGMPKEQTVNGVRTLFKRDALGRVASKLLGFNGKDALRTLDYTWTPADQIETMTNAVGERTKNTYDALGRLTRVAIQTVNANGTVTDHGTRHLAYDAVGNLTLERDESQLTTCHVYDEFNRSAATTPPGVGTTQIVYERAAANPITRDMRSVKATTITPTGERSEVFTDGLGRTWLTVASDGTMLRSRYGKGLLIAQDRLDAGGKVRASKHISYYPSTSRRHLEWDWATPEAHALCEADPGACEVGVITHTYTSTGRPLGITDAAGNRMDYQYRAVADSPIQDGTMLLESITTMGLTKTEFIYDGTYPVHTGVVETSLLDKGHPSIVSIVHRDRWLDVTSIDRRWKGEVETTAFVYDGAGRLKRSTFLLDGKPESATAYEYDAYGRTISKHYKVAGRPAATLQWAYKLNGLLRAVTYPSGNKVRYTYHPGTARLSGIDLLGSRHRIASFPSYDEGGRLTELRLNATNGPSIQLERAFDMYGREYSRTIKGLNARNSLKTEIFGYDTFGRLASRHIETKRDSLRLEFQYDTRDYLVAERHRDLVSGSHSEIGYTYDRAGRRIKRERLSPDGAASSDSYTYTDGHRLKTVNETPVQWDAFGRQIADLRGQSITYGLSNQVRRITSERVAESYLSDPTGQRVARTSASGDLLQFYFTGSIPGAVMHRKDVRSRSSQDVVLSPGGTVLAFLNNEPGGSLQVVPVLANVTGSPEQIGSGREGVMRSYEAYGSTETDDDVELGFHQMWKTEAEGLLQAGPRLYDPELGRFLTQDPLGLASSPQLSEAVDPYRYALNNPNANMDPSGFAPFAVFNGIVMDDWMYEGFEAMDPKQSYTSSLLDKWQSSAGVSFTYGKPAPWGMSGSMTWVGGEGWMTDKQLDVYKQVKAMDQILEEAGLDMSSDLNPDLVEAVGKLQNFDSNPGYGLANSSSGRAFSLAAAFSPQARGFGVTLQNASRDLGGDALASTDVDEDIDEINEGMYDGDMDEVVTAGNEGKFSTGGGKYFFQTESSGTFSFEPSSALLATDTEWELGTPVGTLGWGPEGGISPEVQLGGLIGTSSYGIYSLLLAGVYGKNWPTLLLPKVENLYKFRVPGDVARLLSANKLYGHRVGFKLLLASSSGYVNQIRLSLQLSAQRYLATRAMMTGIRASAGFGLYGAAFIGAGVTGVTLGNYESKFIISEMYKQYGTEAPYVYRYYHDHYGTTGAGVMLWFKMRTGFYGKPSDAALSPYLPTAQ